MKNGISFIVLLLMFQNIMGQESASFQKSLEKHLAAIEERNLTDIAATVSDSVTLIFPNGKILKSKEKFMEFHKNWFQDPNWKLTPEILSIQKSDSLGYALVKYRYEGMGKNNIKSVHHTYLLLIFKQINGKWLLLHDQNTRIKNN